MDVEDDEMVEAFQQVYGSAHVGLRLGGVLTDHEYGAKVTSFHRIEHLSEVPAIVRRDSHAPLGVEFRSGIVVGDVLEARELVG